MMSIFFLHAEQAAALSCIAHLLADLLDELNSSTLAMLVVGSGECIEVLLHC